MTAVSAVCVLLHAIQGLQPVGDADAWPGFRGPGGRSVAPGAVLPAAFSDGSEVSETWSVPLPGGGFSQPVAAGGRVFLTANSGFDAGLLHVLAFDVNTGTDLWERTFTATGRTGTYEPDMRVATSTPVTDGEFIFAQYSSNDVVCLTADGVPVWYRGLTADYPNVSNSLGMSSSPVLARAADGSRTLVVMAENDAESRLFGLDPATGVSRWVKERPAAANWSSPAVLPAGSDFGNDGDLVLCQGSYGLDAVDPATGDIAWHWGEGASTIVSPTVADGLILVVADGITALEPGGDGPEVAWSNNRLRPSYASPVAFESAGRGLVATLTEGGILSVADLRTGEELGKARLDGSYAATPVAIGGGQAPQEGQTGQSGSNAVLLCSNKDGAVTTVRFDEDGKPEVATVHKFGGDGFWGGPAVAGGAVFLRDDMTLWKVGGGE